MLLVNYYYAPMVDAHAYRWTQLCEHWVEKGYDVDVICSSVSNVPTTETLNGVNVFRVGLIKGRKIQSANKSSPAVARYRSYISNALKKVYRKLYWPDGLWYWFFSASLELMKRRGLNYDLIISYSPSFTAHLAVFLFGKTSGGKFQWVADYGDPFSTSQTMPNNNERLYGRLNHFAESLVIKRASKICFTSERTREDYLAKFGVLKNAWVIPHLANVDSIYAKTSASSDKLVTRLVFVGNFHINIREPYVAVAVISALAEKMKLAGRPSIRFDIYGASNGVDMSTDSKSFVKWHGPLERERFEAVIGTADFLVNIENINCSMIPSKIVEYISSGKPIINVAAGSNDVSPLLEDYAAQGGALVVVGVEPTGVDRLEAFVNEYVGKGKIDHKMVSDFLKDYSIEEVSNRYLSGINYRVNNE
ncbi:glycosyltransferase [Pseudomonas quasicaspiana]|uniref:glycosyltransferase n=1 Tax=Pseudomonas quasicaspiana TaxID=2829821 RepID=UPI001E428B34|nr:glycosyltransferase [Pseudomonas quasicaspiana]